MIYGDTFSPIPQHIRNAVAKGINVPSASIWGVCETRSEETRLASAAQTWLNKHPQDRIAVAVPVQTKHGTWFTAVKA